MFQQVTVGRRLLRSGILKTCLPGLQQHSHRIRQAEAADPRGRHGPVRGGAGFRTVHAGNTEPGAAASYRGVRVPSGL